MGGDYFIIVSVTETREVKHGAGKIFFFRATLLARSGDKASLYLPLFLTTVLGPLIP